MAATDVQMFMKKILCTRNGTGFRALRNYGPSSASSVLCIKSTIKHTGLSLRPITHPSHTP